MARWHEAYCRRPQVSAPGGLPCCSFCLAVGPAADDIGVRPAPARPYVPPSRNSAVLDLVWPASVNYIGRSAAVPGDSVPNGVEGGFEHDSTQVNATAGSPSGPSVARIDRLHPVLESANHMRLLHLAPGSGDDPIHADFVSVSLHDGMPEYEALSYTWADLSGDASLSRPIFLGPYWDVLQVTNNCDAMLRSIRLSHAARLVWVDAVCIDQQDDRERSAQVQLMRKIYARACRVLVYLCNAFPDSDKALDLISRKDFVDIFGLAARMPRTGSKPALTKQREFRAKAALDELLERPYFQRLWVVQEFVFAESISVHCGATAVPWPLSGLEDGRTAPVASRWVRYRHRKSQLANTDLWDILVDTRDCLCFDPRDKVFAVLGLVGSWNNRPIFTDYSLTVEDVYTGVAAYLGQVCGRFPDLLGLAPTQGKSRYRLPSWVPDWSDGAGPDFARFLLNQSNRDKIVTLPNTLRVSFTKMSRRYSVEVRSDDGALQVTAVKLGLVHNQFTADSAEEGCWPFQGPWSVPGCRPRLILPPISPDKGDALFWLHGVERYAVLRPLDNDASSFFLVGTCDLIFTVVGESRRIGTVVPVNPQPRLRSDLTQPTVAIKQGVLRTIRKFGLEEKKAILYLCWRHNLVQRPKDVEIFKEQEYQRALERLLGVLCCVRHGLVRSEKLLWEAWVKMEAELSWLLQDPNEIRYLLDAMRSLEQLAIRPNTQPLYQHRTGHVGAIAGVPRILWSRLKCGVFPRTRERYRRPNDDTIYTVIRKLEEWAAVTENLLFAIRRSSELLRDNESANIPGATLPGLWSSMWQDFIALVGERNAQSDRDVDKNLAVLVLEILSAGVKRFSSSTTNMDMPAEWSRFQAFMKDTSYCIWDRYAFTSLMERRMNMWAAVEEVDKEEGWSAAMFGEALPRLPRSFSEQLVAQAELWPLGFNLHTTENIWIC